MKKTVLALVAILTLAGLTATAQKSSKYLIGSVSYTKSTDVDAEYSISPMVGYYVTNKSSLGAFAKIGESADGTATSFGVFGRNDFMTIGKNCSIFSQLSLASNSEKAAGVTTSTFNADFGLGMNYSLTKKWGLTMDLTKLVSYESGDGVSTTTIGFGNISNPFSTANIGLVYKF